MFTPPPAVPTLIFPLFNLGVIHCSPVLLCKVLFCFNILIYCLFLL